MTGSPISDYGYTMPYAPYAGPTPRVRTSVGGLGLATTILLSLDAAIAALAIGFLAWRHSLLSKFLNDPNTVAPNDLLDSDKAARSAIGWFFIFTLATVVVFLCWFWAARANAEAYTPNRGTLTPGWAIGGWFVPVAGHVLPCLVARDIYRGTMAGRRGKPNSGGAVTGWWWALYVAFWFLGLVVIGERGRAAEAVDPLDHVRDLRATIEAGVFALAVGVGAAALAIAYVRVVTKTQKARNREGAWFGGPGMPATAYGYGPPMPGQPWSAPNAMPYPVPYPTPTPDRIPVAETQTAETQTAETQTGEIQNLKPPEEPGDRLTPPS